MVKFKKMLRKPFLRILVTGSILGALVGGNFVLAAAKPESVAAPVAAVGETRGAAQTNQKAVQKYENALKVLDASVALFRAEGKNVIEDASRSAEGITGEAAQVLKQASGESNATYQTTLEKLEGRLNAIKALQSGGVDEGKGMVGLLAEINSSSNELEQSLNGMLDKLGEAYKRAYSMNNASGAVKQADFSKQAVLDKFSDNFRQLQDLKQSITETILAIVEQERQNYRQKNMSGTSSKVTEILSLWGKSEADTAVKAGSGDGFSLGANFSSGAGMITAASQPLPISTTNSLGSYSYTTWGGWAGNSVLSGSNNDNSIATQNQINALQNQINDLQNADTRSSSNPTVISTVVAPPNVVPMLGTATFRGTVVGSYQAGSAAAQAVSGTVNLSANFDGRSIQGRFLLKTVSGALITSATVNGGWNAGTTAINGTVRSANGMTGTINGSFRGTTANEVGANWAMSGGGKVADGNLAARRQ